LRGYARLRTLLKKANVILIVGHQNADPDAVCSAYAFSVLARRINRKLKVSFASPDGVSKLSKQILKVVPLDVTDEPEPSAADLIVTVDTNTLQQLGPLKEPVLKSARPIVMIDHHAPHPENARTAALVICDEKATSTCEMILEMYTKFGVPLGPEVSQALMIGMLVETGHMSIGTRRTFKSACLLIEAGADPEPAFAVTRTTMDESERIARIKSAQRVRLEHVGRWVIALSEVGSYHASAARGLVSLGAHLAVVAGKRNDELTLSFRSTRDFAEGTGMHLGSDLAAPLGNRLGGMGGGHATAAGASVSGNVNEALRIVLEIVKDFVSRSPKSNRSAGAYERASSQIGVITQE
jgi:nanoRNase/pAp phosphatase (c-di-AMP/oligoRNAs hydrolase)